MADLREAARALLDRFDSEADQTQAQYAEWDGLRAALDAPQAEASAKAGAGEAVAMLSCPFCGEGDFDSIGLKGHLSHGDCAQYRTTPLIDTRTGRAHPAPSPAGVVEAVRVAERAILGWSATHPGDLGSGPAVLAALRAAQEPPRAKPEGGEGCARA